MLGICNRLNLLPAINIPCNAESPLKITGIILIIGGLSAASLLLPNVGYALGTAAGGTMAGVILIALANRRPQIRPPQVPPPQRLPPHVPICNLCSTYKFEFPKIRNIITTPLLDKLLTFLNSKDIAPMAAISCGFHKYIHPKFLPIRNRLQNLFEEDDFLVVPSLRRQVLWKTTSFFQEALSIIKNAKKMLHLLIDNDNDCNKDPQRRAHLQQSIYACAAIQETLLASKNPEVLYQSFKNIIETIRNFSRDEVWQISIHAALRKDRCMIQLLLEVQNSLDPGDTLRVLIINFACGIRAKGIEEGIKFLLDNFPISFRIDTSLSTWDASMISGAIATNNVTMVTYLLPCIYFQGDKNKLKHALIRLAISEGSEEAALYLLKHLLGELSYDQLNSLLTDAYKKPGLQSLTQQLYTLRNNMANTSTP